MCNRSVNLATVFCGNDQSRLQDACEIDPNLHIVRQSDDPNVLELTAWDCAFLW